MTASRSIDTKAGELSVLAPPVTGAETVLADDALAFVADLAGAFRGRIVELLARREERKARWDEPGGRPGFLAETRGVRESDWTVAPLPADLLDRRVEITGPTSRKMVINALNSGASAFMADFEDASSPTWQNLVEGQQSLYDAVRRTITFDDPGTGKRYELVQDPAVLLVRPRGLHLWEEHVHLEGRPIPGALLDFGLYFFLNAQELRRRGSGPYFYLPKLESHLEARLWNDVFLRAEQALDLPLGTIKATVLIETLPAAFEMDEILFELRDHSAGLNCGRWDYIFSFIKTFRAHGDRVLPDRGQVTMEQPFMSAYADLVVKTCHRRGVHAMGGMAAQIPIKHDPARNGEALEKVRADKLREVQKGHDGTWVAHPGLVPVARAVFDEHMPAQNQIHRKREDVEVTAEDLIRLPEGTRTEAGLRQNVSVGVQYVAAWLGGDGCVPLYDLMEDAATSEISRTQLWQWVRYGARLDDGRTVTAELFREVLADELRRIEESLGHERFAAGHFDRAARLFHDLVTAERCADFLTVPAYEQLRTIHQPPEPGE